MKYIYCIFFIVLVSCSSSDDAENIPPDSTIDEPTPDTPDDTDDPANTSLYFPPVNSDTWEITTPETLGWNIQALEELRGFLTAAETKAFMVLQDGKIVIEDYYNGASASDNNPWFSAGKTLTSFTAGLAQDAGFLAINDASTNYLGEGWTMMTTAQEQAITIRNQLTMTNGGDYTVSNTSCTDPECLLYLNDPNSFWYYHNAFYSLVQPVIHSAIPEGFDAFFNERLKNRIGMDGAWIQLGYNRIYLSTARSMARFGLLNLNRGNWDGTQLLSEAYFDEMTNTCLLYTSDAADDLTR